MSTTPLGRTRASTIRRLVPLLILVAVLAPATPAQAHAYLEQSSPADGEVLTSAPADLQLSFSEGVVVEATRADVVDASGRHYRPTGIRSGATDEVRGVETPVTLVLSLPPLPRSAYRVSWETVSSDDLHRTSGVVVFGVGSSVAAGPFTESLPRPDEAVVRWLLFLAVAVSFGGVLVERLLSRLPDSATVPLEVRCRRWVGRAAAVGLVLAAALLADQLAATGWAADRLLSGSYGRAWLLREGGLALLVLAGSARLNAAAQRRAVGVGAVLVGVGGAFLGHAATGDGSAPLLVVADAAHLVASATWIGAVIVLAAVATWLVRSGDDGRAIAGTLLRSFARPATLCAAVVVVTGVLLVSGAVGSADALLLTFYGRTLLLKLALVGVVGGLGLTSWVRLRRPVRTRSGLVQAEAATGISVLLLAAILTSAQPAQEPQLVQRPALATVPVLDGQADDLQETVALRPNRPGTSVVVVGVFDTRRPAPAPITGVDISVGGVAATGVAKLTDGQWSAPVQLAAPGVTNVVLRVHRTGLRDAVRTYRWVVAGAPVARRAPTVSTAPIGSVLRLVAAGLAVLFAWAWLVVAWERRRFRLRSKRSLEQVADRTRDPSAGPPDGGDRREPATMAEGR